MQTQKSKGKRALQTFVDNESSKKRKLSLKYNLLDCLVKLIKKKNTAFAFKIWKKIKQLYRMVKLISKKNTAFAFKIWKSCDFLLKQRQRFERVNAIISKVEKRLMVLKEFTPVSKQVLKRLDKAHFQKLLCVFIDKSVKGLFSVFWQVSKSNRTTHTRALLEMEQKKNRLEASLPSQGKELQKKSFNLWASVRDILIPHLKAMLQSESDINAKYFDINVNETTSAKVYNHLKKQKEFFDKQQQPIEEEDKEKVDGIVRMLNMVVGYRKAQKENVCGALNKQKEEYKPTLLKHLLPKSSQYPPVKNYIADVSDYTDITNEEDMYEKDAEDAIDLTINYYVSIPEEDEEEKRRDPEHVPLIGLVNLYKQWQQDQSPSSEYLKHMFKGQPSHSKTPLQILFINALALLFLLSVDDELYTLVSNNAYKLRNVLLCRKTKFESLLTSEELYDNYTKDVELTESVYERLRKEVSDKVEAALPPKQKTSTPRVEEEIVLETAYV